MVQIIYHKNLCMDWRVKKERSWTTSNCSTALRCSPLVLRWTTWGRLAGSALRVRYVFPSSSSSCSTYIEPILRLTLERIRSMNIVSFTYLLLRPSISIPYWKLASQIKFLLFNKVVCQNNITVASILAVNGTFWWSHLFEMREQVNT